MKNIIDSGKLPLVDKAFIGRKLLRVEGYLKQIRLKRDPGVSLLIKDS